MKVGNLESEHRLLTINWPGCESWVELVNWCTRFTPLSPPPPPPKLVHLLLRISGCITFLPLDGSAQAGVTFPPHNWLHLACLLSGLLHLRLLIKGCDRIGPRWWGVPKSAVFFLVSSSLISFILGFPIRGTGPVTPAPSVRRPRLGFASEKSRLI